MPRFSGSQGQQYHKKCESNFSSGSAWGNKPRGYFGDQEEELVREYKTSDDVERRKEIFTDLYPKFQYLVTSIVYNFRIPIHFPDDVEFIKQDCMCYILEGLEKFDPEKMSKKTGKTSKFYSYASVITSNYLRQIIKKRKNRNKFENELSLEYQMNMTGTHGASRISLPQYDIPLEEVEERYLLREFFDILCENMQDWPSVLQKENDQKVMSAIVKIFEDSSRLDHFTKKEIYFLIKEMTDLKSQQINGSLKNIRKIYAQLKTEYYEHAREAK